MIIIVSLFYFRGKWGCFLLPLFTTGHGDKGRVDMVKGEGSYHTKRYDKDVSRTGVRLEFPLMVKFRTDSCLTEQNYISYMETKLLLNLTDHPESQHG